VHRRVYTHELKNTHSKTHKQSFPTPADYYYLHIEISKISTAIAFVCSMKAFENSGFNTHAVVCCVHYLYHCRYQCHFVQKVGPLRKALMVICVSFRREKDIRFLFPLQKTVAYSKSIAHYVQQRLSFKAKLKGDKIGVNSSC
jgi:hypothetical protein